MSEIEDPEPYALTEQHVAALERAIRAEGYRILVNTETGAVTLVNRHAILTPFRG